MSKKRLTIAADYALATFEPLERRDLFSVALAAHVAWPTIHSAAAIQLPKLQAIPSLTGTGLSGEYFTDANFQTAYILRQDATVNLSPSRKDAATTQANSVRWTGQLSPTYTEAYSFSVIAGGGVRLWVNGQLLIDQAQSAGGNLRSAAKISLIAGLKYTIELEYTRRSAPGTKVQLIWSSLHQKLGLIPQKAMFPDVNVTLPATNAGLIGQYYSGQNFNTLVMERVDPTIDFSFGKIAPSPLINASAAFSVRWTGQILPQYSETYTFTTISDDGVRLYVDDQLIIDDFVIHPAKNDSAQITLVAGQKYDIRMDYFESHGSAVAQLRWSSASQALEVVPATALSSTPAATAGTLVATAIDSTSILLNWTGSSSAIGYLVEQSTDGGLTYQTIETTAADVTQYEVDGLDAATSYMFRIAPVGSTDTSVPSNTSVVGTATDSPESVSASPASSTSANVSWSDVQGEDGFAIYRGSPNTGTQTASLLTHQLFAADDSTVDLQQIGTVPTGVTSFLATDLTPGSQYQFVVRSLNSAGVLSPLSNAANVTTPTDAPSSITDTNPLTNAVVLNWADVSGETGFAVDRSLTGIDGWNQIATTGMGITTYTDSTVQPGMAYFYRVRSLNAGGSSDPTAVIDTVTAVPAPTGVVSSSTTAIGTVLNWGDVLGEEGFAVLESSNGGSTFSQIGITPQGITTFPVTGLASGSGYQFAIEALNSAGSPSVASAVASVVTPAIAPSTILATAFSTTDATVSWTDVPGESGFILERSLIGVSGWTTVATLPAATLAYTDSTLAAGTSYYYRVSATNAGGTSAPSPVATALTIPVAPVASLTGLSVAQSQVSWAAVTGASQYIVQRSTNGTSGWTTAATVSGSFLSTAVANLAASTLYYYRVQAANATGASAQSAVISQTSAPLAQNAVHNIVYGTTSSGQIYAVDLVNGTSNLIGQLPVTPVAAVRDPLSGVMYFYKQGTSNIYVWDPTTGNTAVVDTSFIGVPTVGGAYLPDGTSYIVGNNGTLFRGASGTLSVTTVGVLNTAGTPFTGTPTSMTFSPNGILYMTVGPNVYTVNTSTAAVTPICTTVAGAIVAVFGPKGIMYVTTATGSLYSLNLTTVVSTLLGNSNLPSFTGLAADAVFTHLGITATASPSTFSKGGNGSYAIQVTNTAGDVSTQPIMVTTTLQAGVTYTSVTGTGWTATVSGQTVTMTYTNGVSANGQLPAVTMNVAIASSASSVITTTFNALSSDLDNNAAPATTVDVTGAS